MTESDRGDRPFATEDVKRRSRIVAILHGAERSNISPLRADQVHAVAYIADVMSPVYDLRILEAQLLKRQSGVLSPRLQRDLDLLVGVGVVVPSDVTHRQDEDGAWRIAARYRLNHQLAAPILDSIRESSVPSRELEFVVEIVFAMSSLGLANIPLASSVDASYANRSVAVGRVLDLSTRNLSERVARRFGELTGERTPLSDAEMVHLYVAELYRRLGHVA